MQHQIHLNSDNIIEFQSAGVLSLDDAVEAGQICLDFATKLQDKQLPILVLIDSTKSDASITDTAFKAAAMVFRDVPITKVASFGDKDFSRLRQEELAKQAGKADIFRFFTTRDEATAWLQAK